VPGPDGPRRPRQRTRKASPRRRVNPKGGAVAAETAAPAEEAAVETTAPEAAAPEAAAPETTAPETAAPETAAPETAAPETATPETAPVPETAAPETTVPETTAPETAAPETTVPETTVPETTALDAEAAGALAAPPPPTPEPARLAPAPRPAGELLWESGLPNVLTLARRDVAAILRAPAAYVAAAALVVPVSILGTVVPVLAGQPVTMERVMGWLATGLAVLTPLLTMRLLVDERRAGTLELLVAAPVRSWELVAGKWLAGVACLLAASAFTLVDVALLAALEPGVDYGVIAGAYAGILLVAATWVAVGLLVASLTDRRAVAAIAGIAVLLALQYAAGTLAGHATPPLSDLLEYVGAAGHARSFEEGRIVLRDVVYFASVAAGALLLTSRVLHARRWR